MPDSSIQRYAQDKTSRRLFIAEGNIRIDLGIGSIVKRLVISLWYTEIVGSVVDLYKWLMSVLRGDQHESIVKGGWRLERTVVGI